MKSQKNATLLPNGLIAAKGKAVPIALIPASRFAAWEKKQNKAARSWLKNISFNAKPGAQALLPGGSGIARAIVICEKPDIWALAGLPLSLPVGTYALENAGDFDGAALHDLVLGWSLGAYQFMRYKKPARQPAQLQLPRGVDARAVLNAAQSIYLVRDLVNTPAEHMGPPDLEQIARNIAKSHGAKISVTVGEDLLRKNYPLIHAVGRGASRAPRLIDLQWGNPKHRKVTLVGKGVCFDTGGLDIKDSGGMLIMKKDMGGAAHALALAHWIMGAGLNICLRVLVPAVENSVDAHSFRPMDIFPSRKGITVEIGNTDAEGRLVLADCLWEASMQKPDLLIDFATLTGAARVALGPELPALFCNDDGFAADIERHGKLHNDPLWRMPLWKSYRPWLDSKIADINNVSAQSFAGAVTAALFLSEFVDSGTKWAHFDLYAWNAADRPGRPQGGEAMTLRALFSLLQAHGKRD